MRKLGTMWECIVCGKSSKYKNDITRHIESKHISSPGIKCDNCDKVSPTREALRQHNKLVHHKWIYFQIVICSRVSHLDYQNTWCKNIVCRIACLLHSEKDGVGMFQCSMAYDIHQCQECYRSTVLELDDLIATKMVQVPDGNGKRLWKCLDCSRERYSKTEISRHVEATHIQHPGYQCQHCDVISKTRDSLRHHVKNHRQ